MNKPHYNDHALSDAELETVVGGCLHCVYQLNTFPLKREFPQYHFPKFQRETKFDYRRNYHHVAGAEIAPGVVRDAGVTDRLLFIDPCVRQGRGHASVKHGA